MTALGTIPSLAFVNFVDFFASVILLFGKEFLCDPSFSFLRKLLEKKTLYLGFEKVQIPLGIGINHLFI